MKPNEYITRGKPRLTKGCRTDDEEEINVKGRIK
jgi:hypothetical protein